jgi:hypothetical protein
VHRASRAFAKAHTAEYDNFPDYFKKQKCYGMKAPKIPINSETFGIIHGDLHTGNWKI